MRLDLKSLNIDSTERDLVTDKMKVNLYMLGSLMLHRIGGEVDYSDIVTVNHQRGLQRTMKFLQQLPYPT